MSAGQGECVISAFIEYSKVNCKDYRTVYIASSLNYSNRTFVLVSSPPAAAQKPPSKIW